MLQCGTALLHGVCLALYRAQAVRDLYECAVVGGCSLLDTQVW